MRTIEQTDPSKKHVLGPMIMPHKQLVFRSLGPFTFPSHDKHELFTRTQASADGWERGRFCRGTLRIVTLLGITAKVRNGCATSHGAIYELEITKGDTTKPLNRLKQVAIAKSQSPVKSNDGHPAINRFSRVTRAEPLARSCRRLFS